MSIEVDLLHILSEREKFDAFGEIAKSRLGTQEAEAILEGYEAWFAQDSSRLAIDWSSFSTWFLDIHKPTLSADLRSTMSGILERVSKATPDAAHEREVLKSVVIKHYGTLLANEGLAIAEGKVKALDEIHDYLDTADTTLKLIEGGDDKEITDSLADLLARTAVGTGYEWRLPELNMSVGPVRRGDLVVLGARPDTGKTTFLASEVSHMAEQVYKDGGNILWLNNEEAGWKVKTRIISAALGKSEVELAKDPSTYDAAYKKKTGDCVRVYYDTSLSISKIEKLLRQYRPSIIIVDQLWKVHGFERVSGNEVARQAMVFGRARQWAQDYGPVFGVIQADGSAEGTKWIHMDQLYGSKTAVQGEADAIITIGRTHDPSEQQSRFLFMPKNKMGKGPTVDRSLRNGQFEVRINTDIARFETLIGSSSR